MKLIGWMNSQKEMKRTGRLGKTCLVSDDWSSKQQLQRRRIIKICPPKCRSRGKDRRYFVPQTSIGIAISSGISSKEIEHEKKRELEECHPLGTICFEPAEPIHSSLQAHPMCSAKIRMGQLHIYTDENAFRTFDIEFSALGWGSFQHRRTEGGIGGKKEQKVHLVEYISLVDFHPPGARLFTLGTHTVHTERCHTQCVRVKMIVKKRKRRAN